LIKILLSSEVKSEDKIPRKRNQYNADGSVKKFANGIANIRRRTKNRQQLKTLKIENFSDKLIKDEKLP